MDVNLLDVQTGLEIPEHVHGVAGAMPANGLAEKTETPQRLFNFSANCSNIR